MNEPPVPPDYRGYPPSYGADPGYAAAPPPAFPVHPAGPAAPVQPHPVPPPTVGFGNPPEPAGRPQQRSYALVQRLGRPGSWRQWIGIIAGLAGMMIVLPLVWLPVLALGIWIEGPTATYGHRFAQALDLSKVTPSAMLYLNLTLASLVLLAMALERWLHGLRPRWLWSVRPGIRWRFLWVCVGLSVVALVVQTIVGDLVPAGDDGVSTHTPHVTGMLIATAIVVLLTTPLQAMGEEFGFRGYLTQAFGALFSRWGERWFRSERAGERMGGWGAVLLPALCFALAHGTQNFPLFFDRFAFGLLAGYLVVRVGGLEAGIALHVLNNLLAFGFALAFTDITSSLNSTTASWWQIPITVVTNGTYLLLVLWVARRMGLDTKTPSTSDPVPAPDSGPAPIGT